MASREIDKMLRREKGKDANLGIEVKRKSRQAGIANLSYREISKIFAYLDADTILMIHKSAVDVQSFRKNFGEPIVRFVSFRGTLKKHLPSYLRIPLYHAVMKNLQELGRTRQSQEDLVA